MGSNLGQSRMYVGYDSSYETSSTTVRNTQLYPPMIHVWQTPHGQYIDESALSIEEVDEDV